MDSAHAAAFGQFIVAAYDMYAARGTHPLQPPPSASFPPAYELHAWITMSDFLLTVAQPQFYGFVAIARDAPLRMVVALRGTDNLLEWIDDAQAGFMTCEEATGAVAGDVHAGFGRIYQTLSVTAADPAIAATMPAGASFAERIAHVMAGVAAQRSVPPEPAVVVTGHSLGAALATLYIVQNAARGAGWTPEAVTFASPRVGDATFASAYDTIGTATTRIVNRPDLAPQLPWAMWGYVHVDDADPVTIDSTGLVRTSLSCAHALNTYLHVLQRRVVLDPQCAPTDADAQIQAKPL